MTTATRRNRHNQRNRPIRVLHYADLENVYDRPGRVGRLAALVERRRDERTLVVGAGDNTALGTLSLLTDEGRGQALPFLREVDPHADTFGNHDFDFGRDWAVEWADRAPATYLCANVEGPRIEDVPGSAVYEIDGRRVGVVGVANPRTADICGTIEELRFGDPIEAAKAELARLRERDTDRTVVLSHCGDDRGLAAALDVDAILGGHRHSRRTERVDGTLLVRTAGNGVELSEVVLTDPPRVEYHATDDGPVHEAVAATYRERRRAVGVEEVVATVDEPLERTEAERLGGESRIGNFVADALRRGVGTDVAVFPAGSVRFGPALSGEVTVGDVIGVSPFGGGVAELELTGAELRETISAAAAPHAGDRGWVHLHLSGATARWDADHSLRSVRVGGDPVAADRTYAVAATGYLVAIDDFEALCPANRVGKRDPAYEYLVEHARDGGLDVARDGRIRRE